MFRADSFFDPGHLQSDNDGNGSDEEGIDKKGDHPGTFGKIWFDINIDVFGDGLIPG